MLVFIGLWLVHSVKQTTCQFPQHIDFQKISEIKFRNEKFNILKPTIHVVSDHFKDVMEKRRFEQFPTKRIFLDKNGFRHFWKGMEIQPNLRKNIQKNQGIVTKNVTKTVTKSKKQPNRKKKIVEKVFIPNIEPKLREGQGTLVKTTFFCPFFGVLTMLANVNMELEEHKDE